MKRSALICIIPSFLGCMSIYATNSARQSNKEADVRQMRRTVKNRHSKKYDDIIHKSRNARTAKHTLSKAHAEKQHDAVLDMAQDGHLVHLEHAAYEI